MVVCRSDHLAAQVQHFSAEPLVVTLDLAGHGDSDGGREAWSMEAFSLDVTAVIEKLGLTETVVGGPRDGRRGDPRSGRRSPERSWIGRCRTFFDVEHRLTDEQAEQFLTPPFRFRGAHPAFYFRTCSLKRPRRSEGAIVADVSGCPSGVGPASMKQLLTTTRWEHSARFSPHRLYHSDKYVTKADIARRYRRLRVSILQGSGHS